MDSSVKYNILIIQENGRHEKNRDFRECFSLQRAFSYYNINSLVWGLGHSNFSTPFEDIISNFDAIFILENYSFGWLPNLSNLSIPKLFWSIDAHVNFEVHKHFIEINHIDVVFSSTEYFVPLFEQLGIKSFWLPNAYDHTLVDKLPTVKKILPYGFCGNTANRAQWIDHLKQRWGLVHNEMVIGHEMVTTINSYLIHLNKNYSIDINYRTFETLGCQTCLVTNYTPGLEKLFEFGKHLIVYQNLDDLNLRLSELSREPQKCFEIALNGYNHVRAHHTYLQRAKSILSTLGWNASHHDPVSSDDSCIVPSPKISVRPEYIGSLTSNSTKRLPIAIITETMNYTSGGVRCIAEVLNRLRSRGYETVCFVTGSDLRCDWLKTDFPIQPVSMLADFRGILVSPYSPTAELVSKSNAIGKFYWVHSYEPKFPEITGRPDSWRIMSEDSYRLPGIHYFVVSTYVRMILELIYKVDVLSPLVPGGVDTTLFKPGKKTAGKLRLLFLSRGNEFRGSSDIVAALQTLFRQGVELEVVAMGYPLNMGEVPHQLLPQLPQPEFANLLGSVDIFVHASHFEGLPLPPLEAMASKCAVIATFIGASDYLLDGHNSLVIPPRRPDLIAKAIFRLINEPELRNKIATGGFETVTSNYTWEHTADRFEEALHEGMVRQGVPLLKNPRI